MFTGFFIDKTNFLWYNVFVSRSADRYKGEGRMENDIKDGRSSVDMKEHILKTASSLIYKKGVTNTSLNDIAKAADISKGTLYYYYSAKDDIIYDIADNNLTAISRELINCVNNLDESVSPKTIIKTLFKEILDNKTRVKLHLYLLNNAFTSNNNNLKERFTKRYNEWRTALEKGLDTLNCRQNNKALSYLILATLDGLGIQKICGEEEPPVDDILAIIFS